MLAFVLPLWTFVDGGEKTERKNNQEILLHLEILSIFSFKEEDGFEAIKEKD